MRTREELAWAAGFYDGEGSTTSRHANGYVGIMVKQVEPDVLSRFRDSLGLGKVYGPYEGVGKRKPYWAFTVTGFEYVQAAIALMWVWLGPTKRLQATLALRRHPRLRPGFRPVAREGHVTNAKLFPADVVAIRSASGTQAQIAARFGVTQQLVSGIRRGTRWRSVPRDTPVVGMDTTTVVNE